MGAGTVFKDTKSMGRVARPVERDLEGVRQGKCNSLSLTHTQMNKPRKKKKTETFSPVWRGSYCFCCVESPTGELLVDLDGQALPGLPARDKVGEDNAEALTGSCGPLLASH